MFRPSPFAIVRVLAPVLFVAAACGESVKGAAPASTPQPSAVAGVHDTIRVRTATDTATPDTSKRAPVAAAATASAPAATPTPAHEPAVPRPPVHRSSQDSVSYAAAIRAGMRRTERGEWPVKGPEPLPGALLPARRIVAFYGNPLVKRMGVLGEYPVDEMLTRLDQEVSRWQAADPSTPVIPALHLIAVVAQGDKGRDGMYRARMPDTLIERVYQWAQRKHGLLFLDIQVGHSTVQQELPRLLKFLERPDVHLGLDPEFSMHYDKEGLKPSTKIGTMMAADVNYAVRTLSDLVAAKNLPPKVLVVHRFTKRMVPNPREIKLDPRVQIVMDMDGFGPPWLKFDSYRDYEVADPVQYTGFKLFFHNDVKSGEPLITPRELLQLIPKPLYIQYQ
ncbi:MAG TPA: hypothetical protein VJN70_11010 [Gemmatimonadaceae bacterium]|nr:hypothetical protein [Gemmatimonadaceae bacterium]